MTVVARLGSGGFQVGRILCIKGSKKQEARSRAPINQWNPFSFMDFMAGGQEN